MLKFRLAPTSHITSTRLPLHNATLETEPRNYGAEKNAFYTDFRIIVVRNRADSGE
jgi:hypothetical protein